MSTASESEVDTNNGATRWSAGRSGIVLSVLMLAAAIYLTVGIVTMNVPPGAESPGPTFYPTVLAVGCYALSALVALHYVRHREAPHDTDGAVPIDDGREHATFTDWRTLGFVMGAFLLFALLLNPAGWIIAAALMFWIIAWSMGSGTPLQDLAVAIVLSCAVQLAFSAGLGLHLPAGVLEGVL